MGKILSKSLGLNHNLNTLEAIRYKIVELPIEEQATYADRICVMNVNHDMVTRSFDKTNEEIKKSFHIWNATSVGNMAYIALYCNDTTIRARAVQLLQDYTEYVKSLN